MILLPYLAQVLIATSHLFNKETCTAKCSVQYKQQLGNCMYLFVSTTPICQNNADRNRNDCLRACPLQPKNRKWSGSSYYKRRSRYQT
ncbi:unnamed protein product [Dicrocoelium dendriticum]|nr:unnamed protein product [Dicrocoelium dendriticum]